MNASSQRNRAEVHSSTDITAILRWRAANTPDKLLYTYLVDGETEAESLTAAELDSRVRHLAAYLQSQDLAGRRVLLAYPPGIEFVVGFLGCLSAQAIAVPAFPPRGNRHDLRLEAIAQDASVSAVLMTGKTADEFERNQEVPHALKGLLWLATDRPFPGSADDWRPPLLVPGDLAYLQYTSGSAGVPKGVMVSHDNIIQNSKAIQPACTVTPPDMWEPCAVTWLPHFHDMGLIDGIVQPLFSGYRSYVMAPQAFVATPVRWLQAISRYRATHSGGPNFAYRLCVDRVSREDRDALELGSWVNAYTGSEPIHADTLRQFAEYFAPAGFQSRFFFPCYGMAETTLMISGGPLHDQPSLLDLDAAALERHRVVPAEPGAAGTRMVVGCGSPCAGIEVAVVHEETGLRCPPGEIGELWVAGGSVTQGYWNRPDETAAAFDAVIAGTGEGPFLRTGDLGFQHGDEIFVTGRRKDLVIIRGRNHYPQDIEHSADRSHPALRPASAAFSVEIDGQEQLVLVHEVERSWLRKFPLDEVVAAICAAVTAEHDIAVHALCFLKPMRLPTTSSGKMQRRAARAAWLAGEFDAVASWVRPKLLAGDGAALRSDGRDIEHWLRRELGERLQIDGAVLDAGAPLAQYGLDSLVAVEVTARLEARLGRSLSPTMFYDYPSLETLASFLAGPQRLDEVAPSRSKPSPGDEPIAVIGLACRFPGAASPSEFWHLLEHGVDAITRFPAARPEADLFQPESMPPGHERASWGGFLPEVETFDARFFGIAPREAESMDPQQRLLLEVAWEALEDAGAVDAVAGSATGVFVGVSNYDYGRLVMSPGGQPDAWSGTGNALSIAANRLSYFFDLRGPSLSIDTACSSSLVAVHQARESLRRGECRMALAGGVNLILNPRLSQTFADAGMLAADGRCKTFDAAADGYVRGEGCGVVVLKRLKDAQQDGDRIWAVLLGSAVNQDGRSNGLTAPNGPAQQAVIERALEDAAVCPADIGMIEAHGTGTSLGDPIELNTLARTLLPGRTDAAPCWIGSVKTNFGHLEAAAGIAGLIKTVLALHHRRIPAHRNWQTLNPLIELDPARFVIPTETIAWPSSRLGRLAGVSSFGFGGTNAHIVLGEAPGARTQAEPAVERPLHLLALSAGSPAALQETAARLVAHLRANPLPALADLCFSAAGRSHLTHRLGVVAGSMPEVIEELSRFAATGAVDARMIGAARGNSARGVAFLMTGQGSQYAGMGRVLYETQPVFRATIDRCAAGLASALDVPLQDVLFAEGDSAAARLNETQYTQPALFALEYALATLWRAWGIEPDWVMGHSVGEYAAACLAGVFSLEDGLRLIAERGRLLQSLPAEGGMVAVAADAAEVAAAIGAWPADLSLAAINEPHNVVVSGRHEALAAVAAVFAGRGVKTTPLAVSHAFHSPLVEPILDRFLEVARTVRFSPPVLPVISNLTGEPAGSEIATPEYWRDHIRQPVQFQRGIRTLHDRGVSSFVEIGPRATLLAMGQASTGPDGAAWLPSLRPGRPDWAVILDSLRSLYLSGARVNWRGFDQGYGRTRVSLPTYPFQRQRYWVKRDAADEPRVARGKTGAHPLLGHRLRSALSDIQFQAQLSAAAPDYLSDHVVFQRALLPAAGFLEMGLAAGRAVLGGQPVRLSDVAIHQPLELTDAPALVQTIVSPDRQGWTWRVFRLRAGEGSEAPEDWTLHLSGSLAAAGSEDGPRAFSLAEKQASITEAVEPDALYAACAARGLHYGSRFRALSRVWRAGDEALAELRLPGDLAPVPYNLHPVLIDAGFQLIAAVIGSSRPGTFVPAGIERVQFHGDPARGDATQGGWAHVHLRSARDPSATDAIVADVTLLSEAGRPVAEFRGLLLRPAQPALAGRPDETLLESWLYQIEWRPEGLRSGGAPLPLDMLPTAGEVVAPLVQHLRAAVSTAPMRRYSEGLSRLDRLGAEFVVRALRALGWDWDRRGPFSRDELCVELGILAQYRLLAARLLDLLEENGILTRSGDLFRVRRLPVTNPDVNAAQLRRDCPEIEIELAMLARCAGSLDQVLCGDADPLQLLFPRGDLGSAARLYQETPGAKVLNAALGQAVTGFARRLPWWRGLRILEIGAGTGGATTGLLPLLPPGSTEYVFTDVSAMFTEQAKLKFAEFDFVRYATLDIERALGEQGFEASSFDLVIAANVLHATSDICRTLGHIRQLLAPGGALILLEGTQPVGWLDLIFGLTRQWWGFADVALRPAHPLLSMAEWDRVLRETGFPNVSIAAADPEWRETLAHQAVIVARSEDAGASPALDAKPWIVFSDDSDDAERFIDQLTQQDHACIVVAPNDEVRGMVRREGRLPMPIRPSPGARFDALWRSIGEARIALGGVVYFAGAPAAPSDERDIAPGQLAACSGVERLLDAVQSLLAADLAGLPPLWLITRDACAAGPESRVSGLWQSPLSGMARSIALEHPALHLRQLDIGAAWSAGAGRALFEEIWARPADRRVAFQGGQRRVARLVRTEEAAAAHPDALPIPEAEAFRLAIPVRGALDGLIIEAFQRTPPGPGQVEIQVAFAGLNFRDVLNAMDLYPGDAGPLGGECAGTVIAVGPGLSGFRPGDRVIAIAPASFADHVVVDAQLVVPVPASLSLEAAATIPIAFATAWHTLIQLAGLRRGERVLIHAASGGVGQAAIQIAREAGAVLFCTASPRKWPALRALGVEHVFDSRKLDFAEEIRAITGGEGVDVVLGAATADAVSSGLGLLRRGGRFLEIGKSDLRDPAAVAQAYPGIRYHAVDLAALCRTDPAGVHSLLSDVIGYFASGALRPLPARSFDLQHARDAFRAMQQARHIGKIVLRLPSGPAIRLRPDASYLISGGLGALGLLTARWMVACGARHIVLLGRSAADDAARSQIAQIEAAGAEIRIVQADIGVADQVRRALHDIRLSSPPLRGIIHAAGLLDDGVLTQQTAERFNTVMAPKVAGAWNLHSLTQGDALDFFILYSSASALLGSPGQANHAAANAFLDALAAFRRAAGLPALSIGWGAWSGIGEAAEREAGERLGMLGLGTIAPDQGLRILARLWDGKHSQVGVLPIDWPRFREHYPEAALLSGVQGETARPRSGAPLKSILERTPPGERETAVASFVAEQVAQVLGLSSGREIDNEAGFFDLGMDSLTAVELKNRLQAELDFALPTSVMFDFPHVEALTRFLMTEMFQGDEPAGLGPPVEEEERDAFDDLSEAEIAALLAQKLASVT
jgi:acyl transferase domain-containing protein/acyl-CoA synthetase (AMP-forming)/AMP-acid ligase II/NADPH:quinone reductase-like Zn-dependent oxidoreductase/acyl carrier protein/ubiquinone/menaquinone biosynthesis C-methylase UbiE